MKTKHTLIIAALTLFAGAAFAGLSQPAPVTIDLVNGFAQGDQLSARNAKNDVEYIGCGIRATELLDGTVFQFGFCQAADADGVQLTCFTQNPDLIDAMKATSDYAFITFSFTEIGEDEYDCRRIGYSTQSFYLPNTTTKGKN